MSQETPGSEPPSSPHNSIDRGSDHTLGNLIIAGATKCGTTSLYNYLACHPEISPSIYKETRYFLCSEDKLPMRRRVKEGCRYLQLFPDHQERWCMEATPDYLCSPGAAKRMFGEAPGARLVFLLREPVDRINSWYRFACQIGMLDPATSFTNYVEKMLDGTADQSQQHWRALEQGRYALYLSEYFSIFPRQNISIYSYEEFCESPRRVTMELADRCDIDSRIYEDFGFAVFNRSSESAAPRLNRLGRRVRSAVRAQLSRFPRLHKKARSVVRATSRPVSDAGGAQRIVLAAPVRERLHDYFVKPNTELRTLLGDDCPTWALPEFDNTP